MLLPDTFSTSTGGGMEARFWKGASASWRPLFGGFFDRGVSIEWHEFQLERDLAWSGSFHPGSLELCLNFSGAGSLLGGSAEQQIAPGQLALYTVGAKPPRAVRKAGGIHRFITVEISPSFLRSQCFGREESLKAPLREFLRERGQAPACLEILPLTTPLLAMRTALLSPPVPDAAHEAWYLAKVLEILAHSVFQENAATELFCHRHQRQNRERVERARYLLERDLENPPSLDMLAREIECSPFHLSRLFAEVTGMSIPKFLRTRRIEAAAELLRGGRMSVTETAMAVGYSSLSAFNKAFVEQMGCCPGLYPSVKIAGRKKK